MSMHGLEECRNYAMTREAKKGRAHYFRWENRIWQHFYHMRTYRWSICAAQEKMKRFTWKLSALRHEAVFRRAMGVKQVPTFPESQEITTDGASYSGKVVLN